MAENEGFFGLETIFFACNMKKMGKNFSEEIFFPIFAT
jgi:hypothetical protein